MPPPRPSTPSLKSQQQRNTNSSLPERPSTANRFRPLDASRHALSEEVEEPADSDAAIKQQHNELGRQLLDEQGLLLVRLGEQGLLAELRHRLGERRLLRGGRAGKLGRLGHHNGDAVSRRTTGESTEKKSRKRGRAAGAVAHNRHKARPQAPGRRRNQEAGRRGQNKENSPASRVTANLKGQKVGGKAPK